MVGVPAVALLVIKIAVPENCSEDSVDTVFVTVAPVEILVTRYVTETRWG